MLSLFPSLLSWSQLSPTLIRIVLGAVLLYQSYHELRSGKVSTTTKAVGVIEALSGILLFIGLWTQLAALVIVVDLIIRLILKAKSRAFLTDGVNYYLLLLVLAVSLIFTGAGLWGFDLPL